MLSDNAIRVRYSGFIIFASQILSLATGLAFTLLLTRNMTDQEFGAWSFIFYLIGLFTLVSGVFPFWATRFAARGKEGTIKTAITANLIVGLAAAAIYLPSVSFIMGSFNISGIYLFVYLLAALQMINTSLIVVMESCLRVVKPQAIGYGLLLEEACKLSLAFLLIVVLKQLFVGAMVSLIFAVSVQIVFYIWLLRKNLREAIQWTYLKEWAKGSTAFIYNAIGNQLASFVLYLLVLFAGNAALGNYQAAITFSTVIGFASSLAFALYPKMLSEDCPSDIATSFKTMLMLALPMAAIATTMSQSLLTILNVTYNAASPILILLTFDGLIILVSQFYTSCVLGAETLDIEGKIQLRQLVKSKIFKAFTLPYIQAAIALPMVYYFLTQVGFTNVVQAAVYVVSVNIFAHGVTFIGLFAFMHNEVKISVAWKSIAKYVAAAFATAAFLLVLPQTTTLTSTIGKMLIGVVTYFAILVVTDKDARTLILQIWTEIRSIFHKQEASEVFVT